MCGICGLAGRATDGPPLTAARLRAMTASIVHRGPDDDGHYLGPGIAMGMRRLSVIDVEHSRQPVANERGEMRTVLNGEIFNFRALRSELVATGHRFSTAGDTETIVHLYEEHGRCFAERLQGMFAVAVWDEPERRLTLARDRMGIKPLYYVETQQGLAFASEVKSLLAGGLVQPVLDPVAAELFLAYGYVPAPLTLFKGVLKLHPASTLVWEGGRQADSTIYWTPWDEPPARASLEEDERRFLELMRETVRGHMVSDVPLGVMLSGGLDSSLITALAAELSEKPVKTFAIGFVEDADANELADARHVARRLGTEHHELLTSAAEHPDLLDDALWHLEEPIADLSFIGMLLLSRLAREHVTVALCGQAADELLGGYAKHEVARAADVLAGFPPARQLAAGLGSGLPERSRAGRGLRALSTRDRAERLLQMSRVITPRERARLLMPGFAAPRAEEQIRRPIEEKSRHDGASILADTLALDAQLALPDLMFMYFDKMSMAASLEVRVPFADHRVVSFCSALPDDRRIRGRTRKELLRRVSRGLLDDTTIDKPKRGFFRAASSSWLRTYGDGAVGELLLDHRARSRGIFQPTAIRDLLAQAERGRGRAAEPLLAVLLLELWHRRFVDADASGPEGREDRPPAVSLSC